MNAIHPLESLNAGEIGSVTQIKEDLYTANGIAPTGERIYFALEAIGQDRSKWDIYKDTVSYLVNGGGYFGTIGSLLELSSRVHNEIILNDFLATCSIPDFWTGDQVKFEQLKDTLKKRQIVVNSPKAKELLAIPHASDGMNVREQTHVVYVSKSPIMDRFVPLRRGDGFGDYVDSYGDLIMSVGVTIRDLVENRGIFRNPLSVVEGGYGGIAMMLHSFTCMVIQDHHPSITTFQVRPLKKMAEIFFHSLPKEHITVNGIPGQVYEGDFEVERVVLVPVTVLANLHQAKTL